MTKRVPVLEALTDPHIGSRIAFHIGYMRCPMYCTMRRRARNREIVCADYARFLFPEFGEWHEKAELETRASHFLLVLLD